MADDTLIANTARRYKLNPRVFRALVGQESGNNQAARSPAGAIGDTQLMPATARGLGVDPYDEVQNLDGGARYLRQQLDRFGGSYTKALAAYNAGPGAVEKYGGVPPYKETQNYVSSIMAQAGRPSEGTSAATGGSPTGGGGSSDGRRVAVARFLSSSSKDPLDLALAVRASASQSPAASPSDSTDSTAAAESADAADSGAVGDGGGKKVAGWIEPILSYARARGWKGTVTSGYRTLADQTRIYNSGVRPAAKPGTSNHEMTAFPGGAIDVSDPQGLARILAGSPYARKLVWAGAKDPVHFSHPHNGSY